MCVRLFVCVCTFVSVCVCAHSHCVMAWLLSILMNNIGADKRSPQAERGNHGDGCF